MLPRTIKLYAMLVAELEQTKKEDLAAELHAELSTIIAAQDVEGSQSKKHSNEDLAKFGLHMRELLGDMGYDTLMKRSKKWIEEQKGKPGIQYPDMSLTVQTLHVPNH